MSEELERAESQAPAKTDEGPKRFVEKGPHVIYDTQTGLFWLKKDSWQDKGKFFNWHEARDYADNKNMRKIGGFDDWRLPFCAEAKTLFDVSKEHPGKGGVVLHIDTIFPEERSRRNGWLEIPPQNGPGFIMLREKRFTPKSTASARFVCAGKMLSAGIDKITGSR